MTFAHSARHTIDFQRDFFQFTYLTVFSFANEVSDC